MTDSNTMKHVADTTVIDPDTGNEIDVSIYKDVVSEAMIGIDSSYPRDTINSPFDTNVKLTLPDDSECPECNAIGQSYLNPYDVQQLLDYRRKRKQEEYFEHEELFLLLDSIADELPEIQ